MSGSGSLGWKEASHAGQGLRQQQGQKEGKGACTSPLH